MKPILPDVRRLGVIVRATKRTRVFPLQCPTIYALLAAANERDGKQSVPEGVMVDAPERGRNVVEAGEPFAFGWQWLGLTGDAAGAAVAELAAGIRRIGREGAPAALSGNFDVLEIRDLVSGRALRDGAAPDSLPLSVAWLESAKLARAETVTLDFQSPLRTRRRFVQRGRGHFFFDAGVFDVEVFVNRLLGRLRSLGCAAPPSEGVDGALELVKNELEWFDVPYGPRTARDALGGALGKVVLRIRDPEVIPVLVAGQYIRIGEMTRFGYGRYRIEELGPDPSACPRAATLLELAFRPEDVAEVGHESGLESGVLGAAKSIVLDGLHRPTAVQQVTIPKPGGGDRKLAIPSRLDRALQRLLLRRLGPAFDAVFEESSYAFRAGLGRRSAAAAVRNAYRRGCRYAVKADFRSFFDRVDHGRLFRKLRMLLGDDPSVALIESWVRSGAPAPGRGVPTGAPLSPLLANLFLDHFDEETEARPGRVLVRYADDFLILYRDKEEAERVFRDATAAAEELLLELNAEKTKLLDLSEPFEFLGYRFELSGHWRKQAHLPPAEVEQLGWKEAKRPDDGTPPFRLGGESTGAGHAGPAAGVIGPDAAAVGVSQGRLSAVYRDGARGGAIDLARIDDLLIVGPVALGAEVLPALMHHGVRTTFYDSGGGVVAGIRPEECHSEVATLRRQLAAADDLAMRLRFARPLVVAKLKNYAALAEATAGENSDPELPSALRALAAEAHEARQLDQLLGFEGAAGRGWFGDLNTRLGPGHSFERRCAPEATDSVNALLNFGYSILYRLAVEAAADAGLHPAVGYLHRPKAGHAALASDLMEPFRFLVDRAVLIVSGKVAAGAVGSFDEHEGRLRLSHRATRALVSEVYGGLATVTRAANSAELRTYRRQLVAQARSLRSSIDAPDSSFWAFTIP